MASAGELLQQNNKRIEKIKKETRTNKTSRYSRPWQENFSKSEDTLPNSQEVKNKEKTSSSTKKQNKSTETTISDIDSKTKLLPDKINELDNLDLTAQKTEKSHSQKKNTFEVLRTKKILFYKKIQSDLSGDRAIQYLMLLEMCNDDGIIELSQYDLVKCLEMDKQVVRKMFRHLVEKNYLEVYQEHDPKTRLPRLYKVLVRE